MTLASHVHLRTVCHYSDIATVMAGAAMSETRMRATCDRAEQKEGGQVLAVEGLSRTSTGMSIQS